MSQSGYGPRDRMVFSAAQLIRRQGVTATGLRDVVAHAEAPRGSIQHYFPGGKEQLVNEAVSWAGRYAAGRVGRFLSTLDEPTPGGLFAAMAQQWIEEYETTGFAAGCPVAATVADCAESQESTRAALADAFAAWRAPVATALADLGVPSGRCPALATLMVSSLEGAILIARAERDTAALRTVVSELAPLLDDAVLKS